MGRSAKIFDCFTFFDELDILEIRLRELHQHVDYFVLTEATRTFSGAAKPLHFMDNSSRFEPFLDKMIHVVVDDMPMDCDAWAREAFQRNAVARGLANAQPNDIIMLSDVDEIPFPEHVAKLTRRGLAGRVAFIECDYFQFRLNLAVERKWVGLCAVRAIERRHLRSMQSFRQLRARQSRSIPWAANQTISMMRHLARIGRPLRHRLIEHGGWHFTSVGGAEKVVNKIRSYAHQERNTPDFNTAANINRLLAQRTSICGRPLRKVDINAMPRSVRSDPDRWEHLLAL